MATKTTAKKPAKKTPADTPKRGRPAGSSNRTPDESVRILNEHCSKCGSTERVRIPGRKPVVTHHCRMIEGKPYSRTVRLLMRCANPDCKQLINEVSWENHPGDWKKK